MHATGGPARQGVLEVDGGRLEDAVLVAMHRLSGQKILRHLGFKISDLKNCGCGTVEDRPPCDQIFMGSNQSLSNFDWTLKGWTLKET